MGQSNVATKLTVKKLAFEAAVKGTGKQDDPKFLQELKPLYDFKNPQAEYPSETFQQFVEFLRVQVYPTLEPEKGLFELGRMGFHGFYKGTVIGGIMLAALKIMKPMRILKVGSQMWDDVGIGQVEPIEIDQKHVQIRCRDFLLKPYFITGMTVEAFITSGVKDASYELKNLPSSPPPHIYNFDVTFELS